MFFKMHYQNNNNKIIKNNYIIIIYTQTIMYNIQKEKEKWFVSSVIKSFNGYFFSRLSMEYLPRCKCPT